MSLSLNSNYFNSEISGFLKHNPNFHFQEGAILDDFNVTDKAYKISQEIIGKLKEEEKKEKKMSCSLFFCTNITNNPPFIFDYPNILLNLVGPQVCQAFTGRFVNLTLEHIIHDSGDTMTQVRIDLYEES